MTTRHFTLALVIGDEDASLTVIQQPVSPLNMPSVRQYRDQYPSVEHGGSHPTPELLGLWQMFLAELDMGHYLDRIYGIEPMKTPVKIKRKRKEKVSKQTTHDTDYCTDPECCNTP